MTGTNWGPILTVIRRLGYSVGDITGTVLVRVDHKPRSHEANVYVGERPSVRSEDRDLDGFGDRRPADPVDWIPVGAVQWRDATWVTAAAADMPEASPVASDQSVAVASLVVRTAPGWRPRLDKVADRELDQQIARRAAATMPEVSR